MDFRPREAPFFGDYFFRFGPIVFKFSHTSFQPMRRFLSIWSVNKKSIIRVLVITSWCLLDLLPGWRLHPPTDWIGWKRWPTTLGSAQLDSAHRPWPARLSAVSRRSEAGRGRWGRGSRGFDARLANLCLDRSCYWLRNDSNWSRLADT